MNYYEAEDSEVRKFIEEKMSKIDPKTYNKDDFNVFFTHNHINVVAKDGDKIVAFCCIICIEDKRLMCYSWCDRTFRGIKAYSQGLSYVKEHYPDVLYHIDTLPSYIKTRI